MAVSALFVLIALAILAAWIAMRARPGPEITAAARGRRSPPTEAHLVRVPEDAADGLTSIDYPAGTVAFILRGFELPFGEVAETRERAAVAPGSVIPAQVERAAERVIAHVDGTHYVDSLTVVLPLLKAGAGAAAIALMERFVAAVELENRVVWGRSADEPPAPYYLDLLDLVREATESGNTRRLEAMHRSQRAKDR